jgi:hypothetical protein
LSDPLHPSEGARFLFERQSVADDQSSARYRAAVITPDQRFDYDAVLHMDGRAELTSVAMPAPPAWETKLLTHAKVAARAARQRVAEQLPPWPPRLLRWRR